MSQNLVIIELERGPYGEVLPPPLVAGMLPEETLETFARDLGTTTEAIPEEVLEEMLNLSVVYVHQLRLQRAIAGELCDDPDARDLYRAVVDEGEPMSLCPLGQEGLVFSTFAPVLRRVEGDRWRVGLEGRGKTTEITASPDEALRQALGVFRAWREAERDERMRSLPVAGGPRAEIEQS